MKPCQTNQRDIVIGVIRRAGEEFISNVVNTDLFLDMLSRYASIKTVDAKSGEELPALKKLEASGIDYLLTDIRNYNIIQFLQREKLGINLPFILILRTVWGWVDALSYIIPLLRKEDIIIAPSEYAKRSFSRISKKPDVYHIPHCLDVVGIQNIASCSPKKKIKTITLMGRLDENKNIEDVVESLPEIIAGAGKTHLNIIGPLSGASLSDCPKSGFVRKLQRKIKELNLKDSVSFKGLQLGYKKYKILAASDIFINATTCTSENFPISNLEAMACGLPIIATDWAGNKETVREGVNGYLIDVRYNKDNSWKIDRRKLIDSAVKILQDERFVLKMRQRARERALHYDFRNIMPRLIKLLKKRKASSALSRYKWETLKNKRIIDFKSLYTRRMIFFLCSMGIARDRYLLYLPAEKTMIKNAGVTGAHNTMAEKKAMASLPLSRRAFVRKRRLLRKFLKKARLELFRYLCIQ